MSKHEQKACPRCQQSFECKVGNIGQCQCSNVSLTIDEKKFIEERYQDCLCLQCLMSLKNKSALFKEKFL